MNQHSTENNHYSPQINYTEYSLRIRQLQGDGSNGNLGGNENRDAGFHRGWETNAAGLRRECTNQAGFPPIEEQQEEDFA